MESIKFESNKKKILLNDDENKVLVFNPSDKRTRQKFYNASKEVMARQDEFQKKIDNLKEDDVDKALELEEEMFEMVKKIVDDVFGAGTTDMVTDGDVDVMAICGFLVAIAPYFREVAESQRSKYTSNLKNQGIL